MPETASAPETVQAQDTSARRALLQDGFCIVKDVLDRAMLEELTRVTDAIFDAMPAKDGAYYRYQGSNIFVAYQDPVFARLFTYPKSLEALAALGFACPKWLGAFLLSKPPGAPPLYWHQDWWLWDETCSAGEIPPQIFLMYYLTDTSVENGCLRVIPGTHRRRIALHDALPIAHSEASYTAQLDSPGFCRHPDEKNVLVKAGDMVIGDARLLHAAHGNRSDRRRSCLTLWYTPDFESLPESAQAAMARKEPLEPPKWWPGDAGQCMEALIPRYSGSAQPGKFSRVPREHLK